LIVQLNDRRRDAAPHEILNDLETDEARSDNDRSLRSQVQPTLYAIDVMEVAKRKDSRPPGARISLS
jgi:hypothetical protein